MSFHEVLQEAMDKKGMDIRQLSIELGLTYEYTRMLVRGDRYPKKHTLVSICRILDLDAEELGREIHLQKLKMNPEDLSDALPEGLRQIAESWKKLSDPQRKFIVDQVSSWVK